MPDMEFFPQRSGSYPSIYAYEFIGVKSHKGYIKIGYTERDVETRVKEQTQQARVPYRILGTWSAMKNDGSALCRLMTLPAAMAVAESSCWSLCPWLRLTYAALPSR